ncbi:MAG: FAA hydrolase family protein [Gemmatimonadales bacterium]|nr:MAG: FAA hydrolase family protein [Gemmatimonadales bacterium]
MTIEPMPSKILCVGKNYLDHAREMGSEPPEEPLVFLKAPSALLLDGAPIVIPEGVGRVDFEGEIAFQVGRKARFVPESEALSVLSHVFPLNDVTARDLQRKDSQWARAKGFDTFCPVGRPIPLKDLSKGVEGLKVETRVNGELRQEGAMKQFIFSLPFLISWLTRVMTLQPGDILATGTPAGVGPLAPGDEVEVTIPGVGSVRNPVVAESRPDGR